MNKVLQISNSFNILHFVSQYCFIWNNQDTHYFDSLWNYFDSIIENNKTIIMIRSSYFNFIINKSTSPTIILFLCDLNHWFDMEWCNVSIDQLIIVWFSFLLYIIIDIQSVNWFNHTSILIIINGIEFLFF